MPSQTIEELDEAECLRLIAPGGVGRIAFTGRFGPAILPVNYVASDGAVLFRTAEHGPLDEDLRTGVTGADYVVAFEIDNIDMAARSGWSVLIQGPAHHLDGAARETAVRQHIDTWAPGDKEMFVRITPTRIAGRRVTG
jgi:nitroimidazol reductase NimA-like FMN-containing flavoprotein (pyridoxamine 5'-phosphate oxidase superfamily)